jgi:hypothetical protein
LFWIVGFHFHILIMDPNFRGKVFLIWILLSTTYEIPFWLLFFTMSLHYGFFTLSSCWWFWPLKKDHVFNCCGKTYKIHALESQMKFDVWHVILEIKDMKYLLYYKMNYEVFQNLVLNWFIFCNLNASTFNHVRPQLEIKEIITIVLLRKSWTYCHSYGWLL